MTPPPSSTQPVWDEGTLLECLHAVLQGSGWWRQWWSESQQTVGGPLPCPTTHWGWGTQTASGTVVLSCTYAHTCLSHSESQCTSTVHVDACAKHYKWITLHVNKCRYMYIVPLLVYGSKSLIKNKFPNLTLCAVIHSTVWPIPLCVSVMGVIWLCLVVDTQHNSDNLSIKGRIYPPSPGTGAERRQETVVLWDHASRDPERSERGELTVYAAQGRLLSRVLWICPQTGHV